MARTRRGTAVAVLLTVLVTMAGALGGAAPAGAADWSPPVGSTPDVATYVYLASQAGDYVGQGQTNVFTASDSDIAVTARGGRIDVSLDGDQRWDGMFTPPSGVTTVVEARYEVANSVFWYGEGRSCGTNTGWYQVDDVAYSGGQLTRLHLRFEQKCTSSSGALHGEVHWIADDPAAAVAPTPTRPIPAGTWAPAAGATPSTGRYLYMASQAGDFVGRGQTRLYETPAELGFMTVEGGGSTFELDYSDFDGTGDTWRMEVAASNRADQLSPGFYAGLHRYPFHNPARGGFDFGGNGRGCNELDADVAVDEVDLRGGDVNDVTLRFAQHCEGANPALRGELRWQPTPNAGAPAEPTGVAAIAGNGSATVSWTAPAGSATGYEVVVYRDGTAVSTVPAAGSARSLVVSGLAVGGSYTFKVAGANASGTGLRSRASAVAVPTDSLPKVTTLSPNTGPRSGGTVVTITGINLGGATQVRFGTIAAASFTVVSATRIDAVAPVQPLGLRTVLVTTPAGTSPTNGPAFAAQALPPGAPGAVTATPGWARATASWSAPADPGDATRTGYVVRAVPTGSGETVSVNAAAGATSATVTGLVPGRSYVVKVAAMSSAGEGASAQSAAVVATPPQLGPFASVEALVARQYRDFVGRAATGPEVSAGAASVRSGSQTTEALIAGMRNRPEWGGRRAAIVRLYAAYFLRLPDAGGLDYWAGRVAGGQSLTSVSAFFARSSEFVTRYGQLSNADFVRRVYQNVLGRQPDASGLAYWKGQLDAGRSRGWVMIGFSESPENKVRTQPTVDVVLVYVAMLGRAPTADEMVAALATVADGSIVDVVGQLLVSSAYATRVG